VRPRTRMFRLVLCVPSVAALSMVAAGCGAHVGYSGPTLYAWNGDGYVEGADVYGTDVGRPPERFLRPTPGATGSVGAPGPVGQASAVPGPPGAPGPQGMPGVTQPGR